MTQTPNNIKPIAIVVEDSDIWQRRLGDRLEPFFEVKSASTRGEAVDKILHYGDLIAVALVDIQLADKDDPATGIEVMNTLQRQQIPFIAISVSTDWKVMRQVLTLRGAKDYFVKDVDEMPDLLPLVQRIVELRKQQMSNAVQKDESLISRSFLEQQETSVVDWKSLAKTLGVLVGLLAIILLLLAFSQYLGLLDRFVPAVGVVGLLVLLAALFLIPDSRKAILALLSDIFYKQ